MVAGGIGLVPPGYMGKTRRTHFAVGHRKVAEKKKSRRGKYQNKMKISTWCIPESRKANDPNDPNVPF